MKQQISKLYPQTLRTEASCYIKDRTLTDINVIAGLCALRETETRFVILLGRLTVVSRCSYIESDLKKLVGIRQLEFARKAWQG